MPQYELAQMIESNIPNHYDRRSTCIMQKADFGFLHEVLLSDIGYRVDKIPHLLPDVQRDAMRTVVPVILREELTFAVVAVLVLEQFATSLHLNQELAGVT